MKGSVRFSVLGAAFLVAAHGVARAQEAGWSGPRSLGQRLYVPVYSSIHAMEDRQLDLAVTVSIRNTDATRPFRVEAVRYFGNEGQQRGERFAEPQVLGPMATVEVVIPQSKLSGDTGANLIVEWRSDAPVTPPVIETVMVGIRGTQGLAFSSRAVVLDEWR